LELKKTLKEARKAYVPGIFSGEVILYKVKESLYRRRIIDRRLPWKNVAGGGFREFWIPGNHLTMLEAPCVKYLAETLNLHLHSAQLKYAKVIEVNHQAQIKKTDPLQNKRMELNVE
jgi:hypothetical protein